MSYWTRKLRSHVRDMRTQIEPSVVNAASDFNRAHTITGRVKTPNPITDHLLINQYIMGG